ncbi:MAG: CAP domain-containing protein [Treponemataceae bacterium]
MKKFNLKPQRAFVFYFVILSLVLFVGCQQDIVAPKNTGFLQEKYSDSTSTEFLQEICNELNFARTNPSKYATDVLELHLASFESDGVTYKDSAGLRIRTIEGKSAVQEAIDELKGCSAIGKLTLDEGLSKASELLASYQVRTKTTGHNGPNGMNMRARIEKFGKWSGYIGENCAYGPKTPREIVAQLIIDDGVSKCGHRQNIFNSTYKIVGIAYHEGGSYGSVCVMDFAGGFTSY